MELAFDRLSRQYGSKIAIDRISATLSFGVYGLLGANGAGKTTLMRMTCGVLDPTSGDVLLNGQSISEMGEAYRAILGYLPQEFGYYPDFTAKEFMLYVSALKGMDTRGAKVRCGELLELVGLSDVSNKKIRTFSGGMKQRLGIAQAVLNDPKILVLDEPTAGLDPKERVRFRNLISNFAKDRIVLLSTHIVSDVEYIADEILLIKKGALLMSGTVAALVSAASGFVWRCLVPSEQVPQYEQRYCIGNLRHMDGLAELRIISKAKPMQNAQPQQATLEDLYLYFFGSEETAASKLQMGGIK